MRETKGERLLDWFIRSEYFEYWDSDNRSTGSCGIILRDPERFDRIYAAAENGAEGSTHGEIIEDWRDALTSFVCGRDLTRVQTAIESAIDSVERWHVDNDSIDSEIG